MTHHLTLAAEPFTAIKNKSKIIESRLFDQKRQAINLGDTIIFSHKDHPDQQLTTTVIALLRYPTFKDMFTDQGPHPFGGPTVAWLLTQISQFYSEQDQQKYGVLGIKCSLVSYNSD